MTSVRAALRTLERIANELESLEGLTKQVPVGMTKETRAWFNIRRKTKETK